MGDGYTVKTSTNLPTGVAETVTITSNPTPPGRTAYLTAPTVAGYTFKNWTLSAGLTATNALTSNPISFTMSDNATETAVANYYAIATLGELTVGTTIWAANALVNTETFATTINEPGCFFLWGLRYAYLSGPVSLSGGTWSSTIVASGNWPTSENPCPLGWRMAFKSEVQSLWNAATKSSSGSTLNDYTSFTVNGITLRVYSGYLLASGILATDVNRAFWHVDFPQSRFWWTPVGATNMGTTNTSQSMPIRCVRDE